MYMYVLGVCGELLESTKSWAGWRGLERIEKSPYITFLLCMNYITYMYLYYYILLLLFIVITMPISLCTYIHYISYRHVKIFLRTIIYYYYILLCGFFLKIMCFSSSTLVTSTYIHTWLSNLSLPDAIKGATGEVERPSVAHVVTDKGSIASWSRF
jgi:hypothetical protein